MFSGYIYFSCCVFDVPPLVLAMESQAEALGQLTTDDLEGKVAINSFLIFM